MAEASLDNLHERARELVEDQWTAAVEILRVSLARINHERPDGFCTMGEVVREYVARASACSNLAVSLGLLTPAEDFQLRREFRPALEEFVRSHPELVSANWDQPCLYLINQGSAEE